jgi:hypothetical protein
MLTFDAKRRSEKTRASLLAEISELPNDAFVSPAHAAAMLGTSMDVLQSWRDQKRGPRFHGSRGFVRYRLSDLNSFMAQRANEVAA